MAAQALSCEESPDSTRQRCRVTPGRGDPRESAAESKPPSALKARVKRWGKSPPRFRQRKRHGKPHREQCRIGIKCGRRRGDCLLLIDPGRQLERSRQRDAKMNGHQGGLASEQNPAYRSSAQKLIMAVLFLIEIRLRVDRKVDISGRGNVVHPQQFRPAVRRNPEEMTWLNLQRSRSG